MSTDKLLTFPNYGNINSAEELDAFKQYGFVYAYNRAGLESEGYVICFSLHQSQRTDVALQIFIAYNSSVHKWRLYNWSTQAWGSWIEF